MRHYYLHFDDYRKAASSAYKYKDHLNFNIEKSLMVNKNSNGPKVLLWRTPIVIDDIVLSVLYVKQNIDKIKLMNKSNRATKNNVEKGSRFLII